MVFLFFAGDRGKPDSSVPAIWFQAAADPVPGLRAQTIHVGRILVVRHRVDINQLAPSVGHVQDGTGQ